MVRLNMLVESEKGMAGLVKASSMNFYRSRDGNDLAGGRWVNSWVRWKVVYAGRGGFETRPYDRADRLVVS